MYEAIEDGWSSGAGGVGTIVLDEADKMLSLGFKTQLDHIWASIGGLHKSTPHDAPRQRPQVTSC